MKAAIIGLGTVGRALQTTLERHGFKTVGYDRRGDHEWRAILGAEAAFICVDTPGGPDERIDATNVFDVARRLREDGYAGLIVVRSTLPIGAGALLQAEDIQPIVYAPEFLRERSALDWSLRPDRIVIGGHPDLVAEADAWFHWTDAPRIHCSWPEAEVGKLAHNARIAVSVSFTNEIEAICEDLGLDPGAVMETVYTDRRLATNDHLRPGLGPYGGKCVPKDTSELLAATGSQHVIAAAKRLRDKLVQPTVIAC